MSDNTLVQVDQEGGMDWLELRSSQMGQELFKALAVCYLRSARRGIQEAKSYTYPDDLLPSSDGEVRRLVDWMSRTRAVEITVRLVDQEEIR